MTHKNATAKVARWALALEEYDVEVLHRPGSSMKHVDALSRNFAMVIDDGIMPQIKNAQHEDEQCQLIKSLLALGRHKEYVEKNGIIYRYADGDYLLKIPKRMTNEILALVHGEAHLGRKRQKQC